MFNSGEWMIPVNNTGSYLVIYGSPWLLVSYLLAYNGLISVKGDSHLLCLIIVKTAKEH